ncbi:hypothetical protein evm_002199 [Chilo suppressalis]|nr:hypothetical protein evm_002199 [Chilo suppressalis]
MKGPAMAVNIVELLGKCRAKWVFAASLQIGNPVRVYTYLILGPSIYDVVKIECTPDRETAPRNILPT